VIGAALDEARARLHTGGLAVRRSAVQLVQTAVAAGIAWVIAQDLLGHGNAFFAPIASSCSASHPAGTAVARLRLHSASPSGSASPIC
jgi:hypothetical protein